MVKTSVSLVIFFITGAILVFKLHNKYSAEKELDNDIGTTKNGKPCRIVHFWGHAESSHDDIVERQKEDTKTEHVDTVSETNTAAGEDYGDEAGDEGNCNDADLKSIIESSLAKEKDNLEAARKIEGDASAKFGGRFNAIVSDAEFAYVNWYGKRNCQFRVVNRHTLVWED